MDRESPELIEQQMQQTRASLTEKVCALENQVLGTIQNATQAVNTTVESVKTAVQDVSSTVKDTVSDSVHTVRDQVKNTLDITRHTQENPWAMVGGAAAIGFVTGYVLFGPRGEHSRAARQAIGGSFEGLSAVSPHPPAPAPAAARQPAPPSRPGWIDDLLNRVGEEAKRLGEIALTAATASLRETVRQQVPKLIEEGVPKLIGTDHRPRPAADPAGSYSHPGAFEGSPYPRPTNGPERMPGGPVM